MRTVLPSDCGNSPRIGIVGELVTSWALRDAEALRARLADDAAWTLVGRDAPDAGDAVDAALPQSVPDLLEVSAIITHGRLAACDGLLERGSERLRFSHVIRFAGAARTARIQEIRTYLIADPA